ncbi:hypothetical protein [Effusibacillus lacus]|uniref:Uncharacterized protein n=1 Tax=Effusibacillus lacus TaxID=1348429 RepID=A0A292YFQ9_9BACL|nr:hypothetical protein [Effusibacillus lacus]TCS75523.1 hypothetical protein EDD64_10780 [Effusibacillus lacus]GAX88987.1 hypothetical protein EFBL_0601 [Effusibacillus lacus]
MNLLLESFRTINRNLGMIWPPVVMGLGFFLLMAISFGALIAGTGFFQALGELVNATGDLDSLQVQDFLSQLNPGLLIIFIVLVILFMILGFLIGPFITGGMYAISSAVIDGSKQYWSSFFQGGFRYLGWGILFIFVSIAVYIPMWILEWLLGPANPRDINPLLEIIRFVYSIAVTYLLYLFYPALIDGKEGFVDSIRTSFSLAWKAFLLTILPVIGLLVAGVIVFLILLAIGYFTHPLAAVLIGIPLALYLSPLYYVWATLVYRELTHPSDPFTD